MSFCRDCADYHGTCPHTGQPCDPTRPLPTDMTEAQLRSEIRRLEKIAPRNLTVASGKRLHACKAALHVTVLQGIADSMREAPID